MFKPLGNMLALQECYVCFIAIYYMIQGCEVCLYSTPHIVNSAV